MTHRAAALVASPAGEGLIAHATVKLDVALLGVCSLVCLHAHAAATACHLRLHHTPTGAAWRVRLHFRCRPHLKTRVTFAGSSQNSPAEQRKRVSPQVSSPQRRRCCTLAIVAAQAAVGDQVLALFALRLAWHAVPGQGALISRRPAWPQVFDAALALVDGGEGVVRQQGERQQQQRASRHFPPSRVWTPGCVAMVARPGAV
jgi:hypothetical protein